MVFFGIEFSESPSKYAEIITNNGEKQVAKVLFNKKVFVVDNILVFHKEFVAKKVMSYLYAILIIATLIPYYIWNFRIPFYIFAGLYFLFMFLESKSFNYLMLRLMLKKLSYKGKVRLL